MARGWPLARTLVIVALSALLTGACRWPGGVVHGEDGSAPAGKAAAATAAVASEPRSQRVDVAAWNERCAAAGLAGRLYAVAGPDIRNAMLVEVDLCPVAVRPLSKTTGFGHVGTGGGVTAVTGSWPSGGGSLMEQLLSAVDRLHLLVDGRLEPVPGLGTPHAFTPRVSPQGVIAYVRVDEEVGGMHLETWDARTGQHAVLRTVPLEGALGLPAWGPDGSLAVTEATVAEGGAVEGSAPLHVHRPDGSTATYDTGLPYSGDLEWGPADVVAATVSPEFGDEEVAGVLIDMASGEHVGSVPVGWAAREWTPDGVLLLKRGPEVGYLRPGDTNVTVLGVLPGGPMWDAAWFGQ